MATITSRAFASGVTVNAYLRDTLPGRAPNAHSGPSMGSAVVNAAGLVSIAGLSDGVDYVLTDGTRTVLGSSRPGPSVSVERANATLDRLNQLATTDATGAWVVANGSYLSFSLAQAGEVKFTVCVPSTGFTSGGGRGQVGIVLDAATVPFQLGQVAKPSGTGNLPGDALEFRRTLFLAAGEHTVHLALRQGAYSGGAAANVGFSAFADLNEFGGGGASAGTIVSAITIEAEAAGLSGPVVQTGTGKVQASVGHVLIKPHNWDAAAAGNEPGVLFFHGHGANSDMAIAGSFAGHIARAIAAAGYPVLGLDFGNPWGNDASRTLTSSGRTYLQGANVGAAAGGVHLVGLSMGAANALSWAIANPTLVRSISLLIPVAGLGRMYDANQPSYIQTEVNGAGGYGSSGAFATARPTRDAEVNGATLAPLPIAAWRAQDDPTATVALNQPALDAIGAEVHELPAGTGHSTITVNAAEVAAYIAAN